MRILAPDHSRKQVRGADISNRRTELHSFLKHANRTGFEIAARQFGTLEGATKFVGGKIEAPLVIRPGHPRVADQIHHRAGEIDLLDLQRAPGIQAGQRIVSTYNAGPFAAGAALDAFERLGLCHIPVGTGNSERLVRAIELLAPHAVVLTPSYAAHLRPKRLLCKPPMLSLPMPGPVRSAKYRVTVRRSSGATRRDTASELICRPAGTTVDRRPPKSTGRCDPGWTDAP